MHCVEQMLPQEFARVTRDALQATERDRERARARIEQEFHIDTYAERLVHGITEALG